MRRIVTVLGIVVFVASLAASSATAVSSHVTLRVDGHAELLAPTVVRLAVSYKCPESFGTAELEASVSQPETEAFANSGELRIDVPCTGKRETLTVTLVPPGPDPPVFELGAAIGSATIFTGAQAVGRERHIRIVA